jgi:hypothetical protein
MGRLVRSPGQTQTRNSWPEILMRWISGLRRTGHFT